MFVFTPHLRASAYWLPKSNIGSQVIVQNSDVFDLKTLLNRKYLREFPYRCSMVPSVLLMPIVEITVDIVSLCIG